jgi:hypothetical protein
LASSGGMVLRYLGIVVGDIKTSYALMRELKRVGMSFVLLKEGEAPPPHVSATIRGKACGAPTAPPQVAFDGSPRRTVLRALSASMGRERFGQVVVGVDPGESAGVAVIADGELVEAFTTAGTRLWAAVEEIVESYGADGFTLKLGRGRVDAGAVSRLRERGVAVMRVEDVEKALPRAYRRKWMRKDAKSALKIALSSRLGSF